MWEHLKTVPAGYTTTYGDISRAVGPGAPAQAVGQAVGRNKVSIMIPCHRVIGADGSLTGYAGGVERKQFLLDLEEPEEVRGGAALLAPTGEAVRVFSAKPLSLWREGVPGEKSRVLLRRSNTRLLYVERFQSELNRRKEEN